MDPSDSSWNDLAQIIDGLIEDDLSVATSTVVPTSTVAPTSTVVPTSTSASIPSDDGMPELVHQSVPIPSTYVIPEHQTQTQNLRDAVRRALGNDRIVVATEENQSVMDAPTHSSNRPLLGDILRAMGVETNQDSAPLPFENLFSGSGMQVISRGSLISMDNGQWRVVTDEFAANRA